MTAGMTDCVACHKQVACMASFHTTEKLPYPLSLACQQEASEAGRKVLKDVLLWQHRRMATTQLMNGDHQQLSADRATSERQNSRQ